MRDRNAALPVPAGRPSKLTPEVVKAAGQSAQAGLPVEMIAAQIGIGYSTCCRWLKEAENHEEGSLHRQFREAIFFADSEYCRSLMVGLKQQADNGNPWAATWLLTHHPRLRDLFSDAAAERRTEKRTVAQVVDAIASAGLAPDDERRVLLQIQARGLGTPPADEGEP